MHSFRPLFTLCASILLCPYISLAHAESDPEMGKSFAQDLCARCHNIKPDGPFKQHPPSFAAIAVYRSDDQIFGKIIFPQLHIAMPQIGYMLTPENIDHVVAYIRSLERQAVLK